jgi:hemerythrin superfamily protein
LGTQGGMDAIALLKADHRKVEDLFTLFESAGERATKTKRRLVDAMITELSVHAAIEEEVFYPAVRAAVVELEDDILEAIEEHHIVKWTLSELEDLDPKARNFDAKVTVLIENVRHHVKEEEREVFPQVRKATTRRELTDLGDVLAQAKQTAPTRPHPKAPSEPPGNLVAAPVAHLIDRALDRGVALVERFTS